MEKFQCSKVWMGYPLVHITEHPLGNSYQLYMAHCSHLLRTDPSENCYQVLFPKSWNICISPNLFYETIKLVPQGIYIWPIKCQCCPPIESSQLICTANHLTGFYRRATLNGLNELQQTYGQTHSNYSLAFADELFEWVWQFYGVGA